MQLMFFVDVQRDIHTSMLMVDTTFSTTQPATEAPASARRANSAFSRPLVQRTPGPLGTLVRTDSMASLASLATTVDGDSQLPGASEETPAPPRTKSGRISRAVTNCLSMADQNALDFMENECKMAFLFENPFMTREQIRVRFKSKLNTYQRGYSTPETELSPELITVIRSSCFTSMRTHLLADAKVWVTTAFDLTTPEKVAALLEDECYTIMEPLREVSLTHSFQIRL